MIWGLKRHYKTQNRFVEVTFSKVGGRQPETFFNIVLLHRYLLCFVMTVMVPNHKKHHVVLLYNLIGKAIPHGQLLVQSNNKNIITTTFSRYYSIFTADFE